MIPSYELISQNIKPLLYNCSVATPNIVEPTICTISIIALSSMLWNLTDSCVISKWRGLIFRVLILYSMINLDAALFTLSTIPIWITLKLWWGPYYSSFLCKRLHPLKFPYKLSCGVGIVRIFNPTLSRIFSALLIRNHIWLNYLI